MIALAKAIPSKPDFAGLIVSLDLGRFLEDAFP
jgi:hypothetical protein